MKLPRLDVGKDVQRAAIVGEGRIRIAVAVEIAPGERESAADGWKRLRRPPRAVAVVPQHDGRRVANAHHDVEIAVHLDVRGPRTRRIEVDGTALLRSAIRRIAEGAVRLLNEQTHAAGPDGDQIHLEVVIPVERENAVHTQSVGQRQRRTGEVQAAHLARISSEDCRRLLTVERKRRQHGPWGR